MSFEKEFTNEQKDLLLIKDFGMSKLVGFAMDYEPPETQKVIISLEEIKNCIGKEAETYYYSDGMDYCDDLESAWDNYLDWVFDELDTIDENKVDEYLTNKLKELGLK